MFGEFELDVARLELRRNDCVVAVQPKVLRLLVHLLSHHERIVSNAELLSVVWPDETVTADSVKRAVKGARRVLGERANSTTSIRTARGHGYQFVAPLRQVADPQARAQTRPQLLNARAPRPETIYIEREPILRVLQESWRDAERGVGHALLLCGEPGIGKSSALHALGSHARSLGAVCWFGRSADIEGAPPYWPFLTILRDALRASEAARRELLTLMGTGAADLAQGLPDLRELLDLQHQAPTIGAAAAHFRFFDSLRTFLCRLSDQRPLLLVLDDLSLADRATLQLFGFLTRQVEGHRILLAASASSSWPQAEKDEEALAIERKARRIDMRGFELAEVKLFIEAHTGQPITAGSAQGLRALTGGNPLLLTQLVRLAQPPPGRSWDLSRLPTTNRTFQGLLERQLSGLSRDSRSCLTVAAQLGRSFCAKLVSLTLARDPADVTVWLSEAAAHGLVHSTDDSQRDMRFTHGLIRDALLDACQGRERRALHGRIAVVLSQRYQHGGADPAEVAHHYFEAQDAGRALHYSVLAARAAREHLGARAAIAHYRRALQSLDRLPPDAALRATLLLEQGLAFAQAGEREAARGPLLEAAAVARAEQLPELFGRAALGLAAPLEDTLDLELLALLREALQLSPESSQRALLLAALAKALCHGRDSRRRRELALQAVEAASTLGDPSARAQALRHCHEALSEPEDLATRHRLSGELAKLARTTSNHTILLQAATSSIQDALELGDIQTVLVALTTLEQLAERVREPYFRWQAKAYRSMHAMVEGRAERALQLADEALRLGSIIGEATAKHAYVVQTSGFLRMLGQLDRSRALIYEVAVEYPAFTSWRCALALSEVDAGHREAASKIFTSVLAEPDALQSDAFVLSALCPLAELCTLVGKSEDAAQVYDALLPYAEQCGMIAFGIATYGPIARYLGLLAAQQGKYALSAAHLGAALATCKRMDSPTFTCLTELAFAASLMRRDCDPALRQRGLQGLTAASRIASTHGFAGMEARCKLIHVRAQQRSPTR